MPPVDIPELCFDLSLELSGTTAAVVEDGFNDEAVEDFRVSGVVEVSDFVDKDDCEAVEVKVEDVEVEASVSVTGKADVVLVGSTDVSEPDEEDDSVVVVVCPEVDPDFDEEVESEVVLEVV